jgi:hypothetical protein
MQRPLSSTSFTSRTAERLVPGAGFIWMVTPTRHETSPHLVQTKCGCESACSRPSVRSSNRQMWSPKSTRESSPASVNSTRLRYTVARSNPSGASVDAMSPWLSGLEARCSSPRTDSRAIVHRSPAFLRRARRSSFCVLVSLIFIRPLLGHNGARGGAEPTPLARGDTLFKWLVDTKSNTMRRASHGRVMNRGPESGPRPDFPKIGPIEEETD